MKTTHFDLSSQAPRTSDTFEAQNYVFNVKSLSAYAVSHAFLQINGLISPVNKQDIRISGDTLECDELHIASGDVLILQIYYHGIRDYAALFPSIKSTDLNRAIRMGQFYAEAESCFEKGAWLSFMLMSAAIFEHLLLFKMQPSRVRAALFDLNAAALQDGVITQPAHDVIDSTRRARNVIHCDRLEEPYITRTEAMDAKTLIDELIARF